MKKIIVLAIVFQLVLSGAAYASITTKNLELSTNSASYLIKGQPVDVIVSAKNESSDGSLDALDFSPYNQFRVEVYLLAKGGKKHVAGKDIPSSSFPEQVLAGKTLVAFVSDVTNGEQLTAGTYLVEFVASTPGQDPYVLSCTFSVLPTTLVQTARLLKD